MIKTTLREFLYENIDNNLKNDALNFIKTYLDIKSKILLKHFPSKFNSKFTTQQMASVGFSENENFIINIDFNDTKFGFVRRLVHELTHVKQMEEGRLKIIGNDISFDNIIYSKEDYERLYHSDEIPKFEEEAFNNERLISNLYWNK